MSILFFLVILSIFISGYIFYGGYIRRVLGIDPARKTPAFTRYDGTDYVPAKNWFILFGHHFASIAGAGPIVGPIIAYMYWGWFGVLLWVVFGSIFLGAVHDFSSLFMSLREGGVSIGQIAEKYISKRAGIVLLIFLWFALIIVIAVFATICAKSFVNEPRAVIPSLGVIPLAVLGGILIYNFKVKVIPLTLVKLAILAFLVFLGQRFPVTIGFANPQMFWLIVLFLYAFIASIIPVHILLQPRDYICSFLLFFGIAVVFVAIFLKPLPFEAPHFFQFSSTIGPLFPVMFIIVACGSISGFHSLVSSGTTSKQLASERDLQPIGYGAMILEGILAVIALYCVAFGLKDVPVGVNPLEVFAQGFGRVVFFLGDYAHFVALVILNAFVLTTLDTTTRITRFLTQELVKIKNKYLATSIVVAVSAYFCISGTWQTLWPMFGASNQLVAGLALIVASAYLMQKKRNWRITFIPAIIMFTITISALIIKARDFFKSDNYLLGTISIILILLGLFIADEFRRKRKEYEA